MTGPNLLLIERQTPDTVGTRTLMIPYGQILALKLTDVIKASVLAGAGFQGTLSGR
jgi:hypothetical protein